MKKMIKLKGELQGNPVLITRYVTPIDGKDSYYETVVFIFVKIEKPLIPFQKKQRLFYFTEQISIHNQNWIHKISQSLALRIATSQIGNKVLIQVNSNTAGLPGNKILYFHNFTTGFGNMSQGQ